MTNHEKESIAALQGSPGWIVLNNLVKMRLEELKDITNLDEKSRVKLEIQALANQKAVKFLQDFLYDLGFTPTTKETNTYE